MSEKSIVEEKICSCDFSYLHPYFYNNPYALRCELGMGDTDEAYMENAKRRATEIYRILFPDGADAIIFNHWIYDYCDSGEAEYLSCDESDDCESVISQRVNSAAEDLRFLLEYQFKYRHLTVRNLETYDGRGDEEYGLTRRNRIVCYSDNTGFDYNDLICCQLRETNAHEVSFVSFKNECIYSIYDDRGCDVVFMTHDKLKTFYHELKPYFLEYDSEEMHRRFIG
ncbi:MAG: DUF3885 domain-containing protein [Clostridiales bacterium]|nr:DUF3885 domain-containing protein [Clostridiales bacterium]